MSEPRVLIVDDNAVNIELASHVLNADGFTVVSATDADDAALLATAFRPDLILMDTQMPDVDGLELTQKLKADPATRHIMIVAFTACAMKGDAARLRAAGCDGYIAKPIDVTTFAATVRSRLSGGELRE